MAAKKRSLADSFTLRGAGAAPRAALYCALVSMLFILVPGAIGSLKDGRGHRLKAVPNLVGIGFAFLSTFGTALAVDRMAARAKASFALVAVRSDEGGASCHECGAPLPAANDAATTARCRHCRAANLLSEEAMRQLAARADVAAAQAKRKKELTEQTWRQLRVPLFVGGLVIVPAASLGSAALCALLI